MSCSPVSRCTVDTKNKETGSAYRLTASTCRPQVVQLYLLSSRIRQLNNFNRKAPGWSSSGLTPFHVLPVNIRVEALQQVFLAFDIALDSREWLHHLRDVFTLF